MLSEVVMPSLGATGGDVVLEEWLVKEGDFVKAGSPLFVVTTDKATVEVEAFRDGYARALLVEPGTSVAIGAPVAILADTPDEPLDERVTDLASPEMAASGEPSLSASDGQQMTIQPTSPTGRILASPLARRMAKERGIDLALVQGSGQQGQILKRDIERTIEAPPRSSPQVAGGVRRVRVSPMRRAIAERTQRSNTEAPHFYATATIDMTEAKSLLEQAALEAKQNKWQAPSITDLTVRAATLSLHRVPQLNASYQGDEVLYYADINVGLVVGLDEGMLVPVIHHADHKNLYTLAALTRRLRERATKGELSGSDLSGGTFTVSNLGMFGLDSFTAVINPPEAGILALGAVREQPAVFEGQIVARALMTATLSVDHRVVDGVTAARFMDTFKQLLENPVRLVLDGPEEPTA
jgi:pyruvate dehydrogenase E2 component (dihydrolipoamide acetyltransferase)